MSPRGPDFVQSLERGLAVIRAFDADHRSLTLSEVAAATGVTRAAARRFLLTLAELGYVRNHGRYFSLTARVLELGYAYLSSLSLPEVAEPHLEALVAQVDESSSLSVLDGTDILYVARASNRRVMSINLAPGARLPAYCTSMGRTLLAALPRDEAQAILDRSEMIAYTERNKADMASINTELAVVAAQGFAVIDQELELGLCSIAVPLNNAAGQVVAAINIGAQTARAPTSRMIAHFLPLMRKVQAEVRPLLR